MQPSRKFVPIVLGAILIAGWATGATAQIVEVYENEADFLDDNNLTNPTQNFDGFADGTCVNAGEFSSAGLSSCSNAVDDVIFYSSLQGDVPNYVPVKVVASGGAVSSPNIVTGGYRTFGFGVSPADRSPRADVQGKFSGGINLNPGVTAVSEPLGGNYQVIVIDFSEAGTRPSAAGFQVVFPDFEGCGECSASASVSVVFPEEGGCEFDIDGSPGDGVPLVEVTGSGVVDLARASTSDDGDSNLLGGSPTNFSIYTESGPVFLGIEADTRICGFIIESFGSEFFGIDNLTFFDAPTCDREIGMPGPGGSLTIDGEASRGAGAFGSEGGEEIESIALIDNANGNLTLDIVEMLPTSSTDFTITYDPMSGLDGQATLLVTDTSGDICSFPVDFRFLPMGPVEDEVLCDGAGTLFEVNSATSEMDGVSACSIDEFDPDNEPELPPGYEPNEFCNVATIVSPISGSSMVTFKANGPFDPDGRLLFSRLVGTVFSPWEDITIETNEIANVVPDPQRYTGSPQWSTVKITCALRDVDCDDLGNGVDDDMDGFDVCVGGTIVDCDDQLDSVNPLGTEVCNGLDDDCNGTVDEGFFTLDSDMVADCFDNCPTIDNQDQADADQNGVGDVCEPNNLNSSVSVGTVATSYDPTPIPGCPAGVYTISAPFTNTTADTFFDVGIQVDSLTGGNTVVGATGGTPEGGPGAVLDVDDVNLGGDGLLAPAESFTQPIPVCLQAAAPFNLIVSVLGATVP